MEQVADFKSELAADIISESVADLRRNQQAGIAVKLSLARQGEERDVEVRTIDRYRYLRLETTY